MSIHQKTTCNAKLVGYLPAVLKQNISGWQIVFYALNPKMKNLEHAE